MAAFDGRAMLAQMVSQGLALVTALHDLTTLCGICESGVVLGKGRVSLALDTAVLRAVFGHGGSKSEQCKHGVR